MKICPVCSKEYPPQWTNCASDGVALVELSMTGIGQHKELVGQLVEGRYRIERVIGKGGMGTVYACRHVVVGKVAAMKVLNNGGADRSDGVLQRFIREAQTANLLRSRHIVEMTDFGQLPNGNFFVVMELLEGQDLTHAMQAGRVSRGELVHIFIQVAEALQLAHQQGIVHRDLKPDNVFLVHEAGDPNFVKLLDFGIAKVVHGSNAGLTQTGVILGTPYYMSPEQARADRVDHRTDVYALGVMLYRAFTGRLPFVAESTMGVLSRHIMEPPVPPSSITSVDGALEQVILRCMEKRPDARFQSMHELAAALRGVMQRFAADPSAGVPITYLAPDPRQMSTAVRPSALPDSTGHLQGPPYVGPTSGELGTARGLAATGQLTPVPKPRSALVFVVGALALLALGAAGTAAFYARSVARAEAAAAQATAAAHAAATPPSPASPPPAPAPEPAAAPTAAPSATEAPTAEPSATTEPSRESAPSPPPHGGHPHTTPRPAPTPSAPKRHPSEIRNPFE